ncbi:uncharacterized protein K452DRAFT_44999 [Aplosporella prunicola CBS 121167]|uniref:Uncharacterized protein n=1 Tax=Aplosporella prunicola CBS 121167 TaxID=1176127 RepID=A0A6A6BCZ3_9PEZI|nr:uncharacterized protein K452DRAFT_44999 [Aplosporella prunicola CBS 121167]KAF2141084.1 hypothetical protein K452DRAFT_44999 [Aplosporella prunicola CBS 121167]
MLQCRWHCPDPQVLYPMFLHSPFPPFLVLIPSSFVKMSLSIESIVAVVGLFIASPPVALLLWKCLKRRQRNREPELPNTSQHVAELGQRFYYRPGARCMYAIRTQTSFEAGIIWPIPIADEEMVTFPVDLRGS